MSEENALRPGTLLRGVGGFYTVVDREGDLFTLRPRKKFRRMKLTPLPGDEVLFIPGDGEEAGRECDGWIEEILPRKTLSLRPPVANVTCLALVLAPVPEPDLLLADRLISRAAAQGIRVVIAAGKADLGGNLARELAEQYAPAGIPVYPVSAVTGEGIQALKKALEGDICCMAGQSGVGKSSLLSVLLNRPLETGEISRRISRGKNTTRHVELLIGEGLRVMDTPGFSLLEAEKNLPPEKLKERYPEFLPLEGKCRFRECLHDREPGCAVSRAAEEGAISPARLERYRELLRETREEWSRRYD